MSLISVVCIGDVIGKPGRTVLKNKLSEVIQPSDFVIANAENSAKGAGITLKSYQELCATGINALTGGNHTYDKRESLPYFDKFETFVRPLNYPDENPGRGYRFFTKNETRIAVVSLMGQVFMNTLNCPFRTIQNHLDEIKKEADIIIIDFHTEATSEIQALGWFLDGKVSLIFGTHTHVQTADDRVLPQGTGYISDIGMVGSEDGILGAKKEPILHRFLTRIHVRHEPANTPPFILNGIRAEIDPVSGKTVSIKRIFERYQERNENLG